MFRTINSIRVLLIGSQLYFTPMNSLRTVLEYTSWYQVARKTESITRGIDRIMIGVRTVFR